jgi:hypothetical protein
MVGASFTVAAVAQVLRSKKGITAVGNAQISTAQSQFGGASAAFDGTGDYLLSPTNSNFGFGTGNFTIEGWIRFNNFTNAPVFVDMRSAGGTEVVPTIYFDTSGAPIYFTNGSARITGSNLSTGTWHHIAVSRSGTSTRMFVNGTQVGSTYTDSNNYVTTLLSIGIVPYNTAFGALNGWVDEFRVSDTARYTANFTPSTTPFTNDANTVLLIHANGTNATTFFEDDNGVRAPRSLIAVNQTKISTTQSQFGGSSAEFDGNDDYITVNGLPSITGDCTIEFWGRFDILPWNQTLNGGSYMLAYTRASTDYLIINRTGAGSQVNFQIATGNRYGSFTKSGVNLAINTWYHMAIVRNGGVWKAFFNGTELTTFTNDSNFTNSGRTEDVAFTTIGRFVDSRGSWDGFMDEFRVSNSARYTGDFTPSTTPFTNDSNTLMLIHADGTNNSTVIRDDNGALANRQPTVITALGNAQISTAQSQFGGASAAFDGTGDYLESGSNSLSLGTGDWTIEMWIRTGTVLRVLFDNRIPTASAGVFFLNASGHPTYYDDTTFSISAATNCADSTWRHIAYSKSGTTLRIFVNGTVGLTYTGYTSDMGTNRTFRIGAQAPLDLYFNGHMDEIRVSNTARYTANFTPSTTQFVNDANTLLLLHMEGANASTRFLDDAGNRTQKGITALGNAQVDTAQSQFGGASLLLDGTGDFLQTPNNRDFYLNTGNWTGECWFRAGSLQWSGLFGQYNDGGSPGNGWIFGVTGNGGIIFQSISSNFDLFISLFTTNSWTTNTWNHAAFVFEGDVLSLYCNGNRIAQQNISGKRPLTTVTQVMKIGVTRMQESGGYNTADLFFNGWMDEMRISNTARYTGATYTVPTAPFQNDANTVLLLHMDGTDASTVFFDDNGIAPYTP